ncbi:MAG TPA: 30S ribosomal protein S16 [Gemmatimonadota bacterium]|nr:30S ribosomal protein S16 [Gemmatimonadota bacterium]
MAVRIRLRRMGAKRQPFFRVVVADSRSPRDGRFLDTIGTYDPRAEPAAIRIDREKALEWLRNGAEPTDSARSLLSQAGIWQSFRGAAPEGEATGAPEEEAAPGEE